MKRLLLVLCVLVSICTQTQAQETIMDEVSYRYLDTLVSLAKNNYARMKIYEAQIGNAEQGVKKAKLGWFEVLNFSYLYSPRNTTTIVNPSLLNGYQFGVGINIGTIVQRPSQVKTAKNDLEIAWLQKDEYSGALEATVKERYFRYIQQVSMLKLTLQAESDARGAMQSIKNKFEKGEDTFDNYSKALVEFSNQSQRKVAAETELMVAKARLEELTGAKLESIK